MRTMFVHQLLLYLDLTPIDGTWQTIMLSVYPLCSFFHSFKRPRKSNRLINPIVCSFTHLLDLVTLITGPITINLPGCLSLMLCTLSALHKFPLHEDSKCQQVRKVDCKIIFFPVLKCEICMSRDFSESTNQKRSSHFCKNLLYLPWPDKHRSGKDYRLAPLSRTTAERLSTFY